MTPSLLDDIASAVMEAILPGFTRARKRVRQPPPPSAPPPPPRDPERAEHVTVETQVLKFIWVSTPSIVRSFGGDFQRFEQAFTQGWVRWQFDGLRLHVWVGPPDGQQHQHREHPRTATESGAIPAALKVLGLKPVPQPSPDHIRQTFRRLAATCHPDRFPGNAQKLARFKRLSAAYAVLKEAKLA